jgi:multiple antibiotic resistance protein
MAAFDPSSQSGAWQGASLGGELDFKRTRSDVRAMNGSAGANFLYALVALLVIIDPAGTAVLFAAMTRRDSLDNRARQARRACGIAFVVLSVFGVGGQRLLHALGIGLPAMKVAGGILLFLTAADMVTARGELRATRAEQQAGAQTEDISVFPLAIPLIAGPGSMTTMVLLQSDRYSDPLVIAVIEAALAVALVITLMALVAAGWITRLLGKTGAHVVGRVLGVLLAAFAAQITLDGLRQSLWP